MENNNQNDRRKLVLEDMTRMVLPRKYWNAEYGQLSDNNKTIVKNYILGVLNNPSRGLILAGDVGCGKTYISCIIAKEMRRRYKTVLFAPYYDITKDYIYENFDTDIGSFVTRAKNVDFLIIDGYEGDNQKNLLLMDTVKSRVNSLKPTIVTVRADILDPASRVDELMSEIMSCSYCIEVKGEDMRKIEQDNIDNEWGSFE